MIKMNITQRGRSSYKEKNRRVGTEFVVANTLTPPIVPPIEPPLELIIHRPILGRVE